MATVLLCVALFFGPVAFCALLLGCQAVGEKIAAALAGPRSRTGEGGR